MAKERKPCLPPITDADRLSVNPVLIERIKEAEKAISKGNTTRIDDVTNIWESIL